MIGDTTLIRTLAGSEWGEARLVEELRMGRIEGADHDMFGQVGGLAVTSEGDVLVYDAHATALRRYDAEGRYQGTIGGTGSGPGEYRNVAGLAVLRDGRIVVNDFGNGRYNLYAPDGEFLDTWPVRPAIAARRPLHPHPDGGVFLHDMRLEGAGQTRHEILVHLSGEGVPGDTVIVLHADYRPPGLEVRTDRLAVGQTVPFSPTRGWSITAEGDLVSMVGERYAIDVHRSDGSILRLIRRVDPVAVTPAERAVEEARVREFFARFTEGWRWDGPAIPDSKPPIQWVHTGRDGTIWVQIAQPGTAIPEAERTQDARSFVREAVVFDVFDSQGRFLGQVQAPDGVRLDPYPVFDRDWVWAVVQDEAHVDYVVRFRIVRE